MFALGGFPQSYSLPSCGPSPRAALGSTSRVTDSPTATSATDAHPHGLGPPLRPAPLRRLRWIRHAPPHPRPANSSTTNRHPVQPSTAISGHRRAALSHPTSAAAAHPAWPAKSDRPDQSRVGSSRRNHASLPIEWPPTARHRSRGFARRRCSVAGSLSAAGLAFGCGRHRGLPAFLGPQALRFGQRREGSGKVRASPFWGATAGKDKLSRLRHRQILDWKRRAGGVPGHRSPPRAQSFAEHLLRVGARRDLAVRHAWLSE